MLTTVKYLSGKKQGETAQVEKAVAEQLVEAGAAEIVPTEPDPAAAIAELTATVQDVVKSHVDRAKNDLIGQFNKGISSARITVVDRSDDDPKAGFKNFGEFLQAVRVRGTGGALDVRLQKLHASRQKADGMDESSLADGGALVPTEYSNQLYRDVVAENPLYSRTRKYPISMGNTLFVPVRSYAELGVGAAGGGSLGAWLSADGVVITPKKPVYSRVQFALNRWGTLLPVTDELLQDNNVALGQHIFDEARIQLAWDLNAALINGNGLGQPQGILASDALVQVPALGGQAAGTINYANLAAMKSALYTVKPNDLSSCVWIANPDAEAQLMELTDSAGRNLYYATGTISQSPTPRLFGIPVVWHYQCPALGDAGDIILADMSQYGTATKAGGGIEEAISTQFYFDAAETAYRLLFRIDGKTMRSVPLALPNSAQDRSGFVCIAPRGGGPAS